MGNREVFEIPVIEFTKVTTMLGTTSGPVCSDDPENNPGGIARTDYGQEVSG